MCSRALKANNKGALSVWDFHSCGGQRQLPWIMTLVKNAAGHLAARLPNARTMRPESSPCNEPAVLASPHTRLLCYSSLT